MKSYFRELVIILGLAAVFYLLITTLVQNSEVFDISMQPTLVAGERLIVVKPFYHFQNPERGDIIIIHPPSAPQKEYVKRLIGLPGDTIEVKGGMVYVDNVPLNEPYIKSAPAYTMAPVKVAPDHYFVLGDNRNNSEDSHTGWTITSAKIVGKVWLRYWPPGRFSLLDNYSQSSSSN